MSRTNVVMIVVGLILGVVYLGAVVPSSTAWGYSGHSSGFYWFSGGNSTVYHERPSARSGSKGGPRVASRELSGGK